MGLRVVASPLARAALSGLALTVLAGSTATAAPNLTASCIRPGGAPIMLQFDGSRLGFCVTKSSSADGAPCYSITVPDGVISDAPTIAVAPPDIDYPIRVSSEYPTVQLTGSELKACKATGRCTTMTSRLATAGAERLRTNANAAGTLLAVWQDLAQPKVELFDLSTGRRLAAFSAGTPHEPAVYVSFAGDTVIVHEGNGVGSDTAWLATKSGKRINHVGGKARLRTKDLGPVQVKGTVWAFNSAEGDVVLQDVRTGNVRSTIAIGHTVDMYMFGDRSRLVLLSVGEAEPGTESYEIAVVDLATDTVTHHPLARCKPSP